MQTIEAPAKEELQATIVVPPSNGVLCFDGYFFRFRVRNCGRTRANNCECVIEALEKERDGRWVKDETFQPLNLKWSNLKSSDEFLHINPKVPGWFCDLIHVDNRSKELIFDYIFAPHSQCLVLDVGVDHSIKVSVYAENAKPITAYFQIKWSGIWKDKPEEMFKEIRVDMK